ncbi:hypothetical protein ACSHWB_20165 [Lentzea sp. HUAS TT2]|uniref:hypothetical protein n=1 Tax=Lentzea sp. HUAS TT2 TaxID=3447454 RepID=UPI003F712D0B
MAGLMNQECLSVRSLLTERLLLGKALTKELSRHLDRCPECTREVSEIGDVVRTLRLTDPQFSRETAVGVVTDERPSLELGDRIRRDVARGRPGAATVRHRIRHRVAVGVAAAALVAAAAVAVPLATRQDPAPATAVALVREGPMVISPGGTEVPIVLSGLQPGAVYRMMTVNAAGARSPGGSVRATGDEPIATRMVTAMHRDTITDLILEDEEGRVVARLPVTPPPTA